nr:zinc finger, CCHC-type [Tanacetum cinerariifolium]
MVAAMKHMALSFSKLEKFKGVDFRRWQKKMHFMLSSMSVVYVLTTPMLEDRSENPTVEQVRKRAKLLKLLKSYKIPWKPNIWLRMPQEELTLIELGSHLRIEESLRVQDSDMPKGNNVAGPLVVSMVEHSNSSRKPGHLRKDCMVGNVGNRVNGSSTKGSEDGSSNPPKAFMSISKLKDSILWHARLGHVHFKRMQDMSKDGLIPKIDVDTEKYKTCMLNKITKKPFQNVKHETKVLELIHSDLCDLHATPSLGNKKYFVTFIDDASRAVVRLPDPKLKTLGERGIECIFVGYDEHSKAFRFYVIKPNDSVAINSIIESMDAIFDKHRPLVCKWIFKRKLKVDGTVEKFKARLVIQGFKQKSGIDYFDTYAPVARISTIRLLIAMTSIHNLIIHQMDVKTAFLNGELEEEVYMNQPLGFIMPGNNNKVCKLIKSMYGLKQALKQWHQKFDEVVLSNGYLLNQANKFQVDLTEEFLSSRFSMKDIGEADVIL